MVGEGCFPYSDNLLSAVHEWTLLLPLSLCLLPLHHVAASLQLFSWFSVLLWVSRGLCVCSRAKVIIFVGTGSVPLGLWGGGGDGAGRHRFTQVLNTDRNGAVEGFTLQMRSQHLAIQLAFRQPSSHSYSALSFQYRLLLLTSLIAFSQSLGDDFDESIKTLCIVKQAKPKSHQGNVVSYCGSSPMWCKFISFSKCCL